MDKEALVEAYLAPLRLKPLGSALVTRLIEKGWELTDAFWNYVEDDQQWTLFIGTTKVDDEGLYEASIGMHHIWSGLDEDTKDALSLSGIALVSPDAKNVRALRAKYGTIVDKEGYRSRRVDTSSDEPIIYLLNQRRNIKTDTRRTTLEGSVTHG